MVEQDCGEGGVRVQGFFLVGGLREVMLMDGRTCSTLFGDTMGVASIRYCIYCINLIKGH